MIDKYFRLAKMYNSVFIFFFTQVLKWHILENGILV